MSGGRNTNFPGFKRHLTVIVMYLQQECVGTLKEAYNSFSMNTGN